MPRGFSSRSSGLEFMLDTRELSALAVALKGSQPVLRRSLMARVRVAMGPAKQAVQQEAATFSTRIPRAVTARASYARSGAVARITVNANKAPHARPINNNDREGRFRHPVFDSERRVWAYQTAHPFIRKGVDKVAPRTVREIAKIYDDVARAAGFR